MTIILFGATFAGAAQSVDFDGGTVGAPPLGFLLVCSLDFPFAEGFGPDMKLTRTQTIMQGASHCDFRYQRQKD